MTKTKSKKNTKIAKTIKKEEEEEEVIELAGEEEEVKDKKQAGGKKKATKKKAAKKKAVAKKKATPKKKAAKKKAVAKKKATPKKKAVKKKAVKKKAAKKQEGGQSKTRFFKAIYEDGDDYDGDAYGRFSGTKPKQAANKALTSILKKRAANDDDTMCQIVFSIRECTRGSNQKVYFYKGQRMELEEPNTITIRGKDGEDDKEITYRFNNKVMKDKDRSKNNRSKNVKKKKVRKAPVSRA